MAESSDAIEILRPGDCVLSSPVAGVVNTEEIVNERSTRPWEGGGARNRRASGSEMDSIDGSPLDEPFGVLRLEE